MGKETFCIRPPGAENGPETETFELSDFDCLAPPFYTMLSLCYKLDKEQDREAIIQNLKEGLEITVGQYRIITATLQKKTATGKFSAIRKRESGINFTINRMDDGNDFPDFATLDNADFPFEKMDINQLFPEDICKRIASVFQEFADPPAVVAQANFIRGGVILCVASHHRISDGIGTNYLVAHWAANARALSTKTALPAFDKARVDRTPLNFTGPQPSAERMAELKRQIGFVHHAGEGDNPPPATESISIISLHFPKSKLALLKADASPPPVPATNGRADSALSYSNDTELHPGDAASSPTTDSTTKAAGPAVPWISTYDAIIATLWRAVTRARLPTFLAQPTGPPTTSSQLHAVNLRAIAGVPPAYYGNVMALPVQTVPLPTLTSQSPTAPDPNLAAVAAAVRAGIAACSSRAIARATAEWVAGTPDKDAITMPNLMGTGLYGTSWRSMTYYVDADFGFGRPRRVRRPPIPADGIYFVYPTRPVECGARPDEGTDVVLALARSAAERFVVDEEVLRYAVVMEG
ncbi:hypothetical protein SLS56_008376 [Neofusicoccum ribis]|uniref:Trichothecene 3-O-acetyltransferase n=1 Tax=Neofusicoccum ribis TaxID=45134 RepID=A0ABR3SKT1_9PEZI